MKFCIKIFGLRKINCTQYVWFVYLTASTLYKHTVYFAWRNGVADASAEVEFSAKLVRLQHIFGIHYSTISLATINSLVAHLLANFIDFFRRSSTT